ncbi:unnamed protein product, partial [Strongylus vulgaris]
ELERRTREFSELIDSFRGTVYAVSKREEGPNYFTALKELEISRMLYTQALDSLHLIEEDSVFKHKARIMSHFVAACLLEFESNLASIIGERMAPELLIEDEKGLDYLRKAMRAKNALFERDVTPTQRADYCRRLVSGYDEIISAKLKLLSRLEVS